MRMRIVSSLEKCFHDQSLTDKAPLGNFSMFSNERCSLQVCYDDTVSSTNDILLSRHKVLFSLESPLADCAKIYMVRSIPSMMPVYPDAYDSDYLRTEPGLYPDLLQPMASGYRLPVDDSLRSLWIELEPAGQLPAGEYPLACVFRYENGDVAAQETVTVKILAAALPPQQLIFTQWFYTDCLLQYYGCQAFDERHWQIIENFMGNAARYGMNMILTPILTPELDTYVGGERPTTQLVEVWKEPDGYRFDFSRVGRWLSLCDKVGIRYLEINHFFTQWGAAACPKVVAWVDGKEEKIFGWNTPSDSPEYKEFLYALIPQLLDYLKSCGGADKRCYFHISDEPNKQHLDRYTRLCDMLKPLLEGYPIMDAMSDYEFYARGATTCPVPANNHMDEFLAHEVPNLWTYYCCGQAVDVSNRFFAMPSCRTRIIGTQFYKFRIAGFLQWGYNFYNNQYSYSTVNPFLCSDGEGFSPSGDAYSVYPGENGIPWPSLRQAVFYDGIQDLRALQLCEQLYGRDYTIALLEENIPPITFKDYPRDPDFLPKLRQRLHAVIETKLG